MSAQRGAASQRSVQAAAGWRTGRQAARRWQYAAAYLVVGLMSAAFLFPFFWMLSTSLKPDTQLFVWPPQWIPQPLRWDNFPKALNYIPFLQQMRNTLVISGLCVIGTVASCSLIAYGFARIDWPGRNIIFLAYLSTIMLPYQVTLIPLFITFRNLHWVGTFLPLTVPSFFGNAFYVFLLRQFFLTIPHELGEAARIDGAGEWRIFQGIVLPLAKPALASVALFTFLYTYTDFLGPLIYLNDAATYTLSLGLAAFKNAFSAEWQLMMAASVMMTLPVIGLFFLTQRTFIQGITLGGIKG